MLSKKGGIFIFCVMLPGDGHSRTASCLAMLLRGCFKTASLLEDELIIPQTPNLLLCSFPHGIVQAHSPIVILPQEYSAFPKIVLPQNSVLVFDSQNTNSVAWAAQSGLRILDCGLSSRSTLTFSSLGKESAVVALQRRVEDINGQMVEPFELPLRLQLEHPPYPLLCCAAVIILSGQWKKLDGLLL